MSSRKPKFPGKVSDFPGFDTHPEPGQGRGFSSTTPPRYEPDDNVDYSAVLQSLQKLPADLIASAPTRRARSHSGSGGSEGYRSDGVVDFDLEVQQFEARTFNNKYCRADLPPFPSSSYKLPAQHQEDRRDPFDMSTAHMRPSRHTTASTANSSSLPGSLPDVATPSLHSNSDTPMNRAVGSGKGSRFGVHPHSLLLSFPKHGCVMPQNVQLCVSIRNVRLSNVHLASAAEIDNMLTLAEIHIA